MPISKIIIVGAGPSGLLLALLLAKHLPSLSPSPPSPEGGEEEEIPKIKIELLEMTAELDRNPRASHYTAESCYEFDRAGVLDAIEAEGFFPNGVSWRRLDADGGRERLVAIRNFGPSKPPSSSVPLEGEGKETGVEGKKREYRMVCLPLHRLGKILEGELLGRYSDVAEIRYGSKVVEIGQDGEKAWVDVERMGDGGVTTERREADYVVGCDGANSIVRRKLFGDWEWPGFTWDKQIVATNVGSFLLCSFLSFFLSFPPLVLFAFIVAVVNHLVMMVRYELDWAGFG